MIECVQDGKYAQNVFFKRKPDESTNIGQFRFKTYNHCYEIWSLSIMSEHRRKGYATQMLREFLQQFKNDKPLFLYVYKSNKIAIRLYEKVGFIIAGICDFEHDAYKMQYVQSVR
jgi:ribosomal protein S18 acetylase RimI-like enzyme